MTKIKLEVIKPWIQDKLTDILNMDDDVVVNFVYNQLEVKVCFVANQYFIQPNINSHIEIINHRIPPIYNIHVCLYLIVDNLLKLFIKIICSKYVYFFCKLTKYNGHVPQ